MTPFNEICLESVRVGMHCQAEISGEMHPATLVYVRMNHLGDMSKIAACCVKANTSEGMILPATKVFLP